MAGGYTGTPSNVAYVNNRAESNQNGLLLVGTSDGIPGMGYLINADIRDNDFLKNNITPADPVTSLRYNNGIRMIVKGREPNQGTGGLFGHVSANVVGNTFTDNSRAVEVDAGFPDRTYPNGDCDWRTFTGLVDATFKSNTLAIGNAPQFITFTRQNAVGKPAQAKLYKYLRGSTYTLIDPANTFAFGVTPPVDDPTQDPGTCTEGGDLNNQPLLLP